MKNFFSTRSDDYSALVLRLTLGIFMLPHGLQKTLGLFEGPGFNGAMEFLSGRFGTIIAFLVIAGESIGAIAVIVGFCTRFSAASLAVIMAGAAYFVHGQGGFFASNNGFEMHLLAIGIGIALTVSGGGALSVDGMIGKKK